MGVASHLTVSLGESLYMHDACLHVPNKLQFSSNFLAYIHCLYTGFFLEKIFRGGETKFSRNERGQAKIHKIYVVHIYT